MKIENDIERLKREQTIHNDNSFEAERIKFGNEFYDSELLSELKDFYKEELKNIKGKNILDYGCGSGEISIEFAEQGAVVVGIDISDARIKMAKDAAKKRNLNIAFFQGNAEDTGFNSDTFDFVTGTAILHHLDLNNAAKEISRVLKPGGKAIFIEPLANNPFINLFRKFTPEARTPDEHPLIMNDFKILEKYFSKIESKSFILFPLLHIGLKKFLKIDSKSFLSFTKNLDKLFLNNSFLKKYSWQAVIVMSK